jgi:hypothetical protein
MPENTVELLKRAIEAQAKQLDKPQPLKRELEEETQANRPVVNGRRT